MAILALVLAGCTSSSEPDFYHAIRFAADGTEHAADLFGGASRTHVGFTLAPTDVIIAGEAFTDIWLDVDISTLVDTTPDEIHIQQLTICDPRVTTSFSRGGDTFHIKPGDRNIDDCTFHSGTIHGILAFQYLRTTGTSLLASTRFTFDTATEPDPGIEHVLGYSVDFDFRAQH